MTLRRPFRLLLALSILLVSGGCDVFGPSPTQVIVMYVGPRTAPCHSPHMTECLLVRMNPRDEWTFFYTGIIGFEHEPGYAYTLNVLTRRIDNPPADGSSVEYRLLQVLRRTPVAPD